MKWRDIYRWLPFNNPAPALAIIAAFIILFFTIRSCEARETMLEAGVGFLSAEYSHGQYIVASERFADGKYEIGLGVWGDQVCKCNEGDTALETNAFVFASRNVFWKRLEMGLGFGYWQNTNRALGKNLTFQLNVGVNVWRNLDVRIRHASNAGSGSPNLGQDSLGLSWRFD